MDNLFRYNALSICSDMNLIQGISKSKTKVFEKVCRRIKQCLQNLGGYHLANQNQVQCIRREKGQCRICYSTYDFATDFQISGDGDKKFETAGCCTYGADGKG